jgi:hypothetical protein
MLALSGVQFFQKNGIRASNNYIKECSYEGFFYLASIKDNDFLSIPDSLYTLSGILIFSLKPVNNIL